MKKEEYDGLYVHTMCKNVSRLSKSFQKNEGENKLQHISVFCPHNFYVIQNQIFGQILLFNCDFLNTDGCVYL